MNIENALDYHCTDCDIDNLYDSSLFNLSEREKLENKKTLKDFLKIRLNSRILKYFNKKYRYKDIQDIIDCIFPDPGMIEIPELGTYETTYINTISSQTITEMIVLLRYNRHNTIVSVHITGNNHDISYNFNFERNLYNDIAIYFIASVLPILGIEDIESATCILNKMID